MKCNVLGVIPARGGSKGIPKKNLFPINGKPLIAYSIEEAKKSRLLTRCVVSTDSQEIADAAKEFGGDIPFMRPAELATDKALSVSVVKHALEEIEKQSGERFDIVVLLQPTTPLRLASDIDEAIQKMIDTHCDSVISIVDVGAYHPARMYTIKKNQLVPVMDERIAMTPRQELPSIYIRSGDVYVCQREIMLKRGSMIGRDNRPIFIPPERSVNIDEMKDIAIAEKYLKDNQKVNEQR